MFDTVETPAVIIDIEKVKKNINTMAREAKAHNCSVRPHIKTHKIPELAKLQLHHGASGITCAKISEAEVMADAGIKDIFIAYPVIGESKVRRVLELNRRIRLILGIDSLEGAMAFSDAAVRENTVLEVRMEVDTGLRRTGVLYEKAVDFAKELVKLPGIKLTGIYTFRGSILDGKSTERRDLAGLQEGSLMVVLADKLRAEGIDIKDVSGGSTPTGKYVAGVEGVTEIRPGTYIFNDMMQVKNQSAVLEECAAAVLVTVISTPSDDAAVVDGGSKTFATDVQLGAFPYFLEGYGKIVGNDDLVLERVNEEHGMIRSKSGKTDLKIGERLLIIPNHICSTVNLHNNVYFLEESGNVRKVQVEARGKLY